MNKYLLPMMVALTGLAMVYSPQGWCQSVQRPVYKEGDTWTYRRTAGPNVNSGGSFLATETKTVTKVLPNEFEISSVTTSDRGEVTTRTQQSSLDFNDYVQANRDAPRQEVRAWIWPVEVGQTWKYEVPLASGTNVWEARVKGWEEIDVPAGRFKTLRVERTLTKGPTGVNRLETVWFSPDAKANVRMRIYMSYRSAMTESFTRELQSYQVH